MDSQSRALAGDRNGQADASPHLRRIELHRGARQRAGHRAARHRHRGGAGTRRPGDAVGRSRRRQDHLRPRHDPRARRQSGHRGAEPDLHADAELRAAAVSAGARRPLPPGGPGRARRARLRRPAEGRGGAAGMAGPRRGLPAAGPARHRVHARAQGRPGGAQGAHHRLRRLRRAGRAHSRDPALPRCLRLRRSRAPAHPGRRLDPQPTSGSASASSAPS